MALRIHRMEKPHRTATWRDAPLSAARRQDRRHRHLEAHATINAQALTGDKKRFLVGGQKDGGPNEIAGLADSLR
jgi:hypothetical protein